VVPEARCAFIKMRRAAIAEESGSVEDRCAQAWGFVSRTIASREGGGAVETLADAPQRSLGSVQD
jgi:hypothetical protein